MNTEKKTVTDRTLTAKQVEELRAIFAIIEGDDDHG